MRRNRLHIRHTNESWRAGEFQTDDALEDCDSYSNIVENEEEVVGSGPSLADAADDHRPVESPAAVQPSAVCSRYPSRNREKPDWLGDWVM